jgi:hypothetical protein
MLIAIAQALGKFGDGSYLVASRLVSNPKLKRHLPIIPGASTVAGTQPPTQFLDDVANTENCHRHHQNQNDADRRERDKIHLAVKDASATE